MDEGQIVRVVNRSDKPFVDYFDGRRYEVPAGGSRSVPIGATTAWLGSPSATGADRDNEVNRLMIRYGISVRDTDWASSLPALEVYDDSTDERIYFPADDPSGAAGYPVIDAPTPVASNADLQRQIAHLQAQIEGRAVGDNVVTSTKTETESALDKLPKDQPKKSTPRSRSHAAG